MLFQEHRTEWKKENKNKNQQRGKSISGAGSRLFVAWYRHVIPSFVANLSVLLDLGFLDCFRSNVTGTIADGIAAGEITIPMVGGSFAQDCGKGLIGYRILANIIKAGCSLKVERPQFFKRVIPGFR